MMEVEMNNKQLDELMAVEVMGWHKANIPNAKNVIAWYLDADDSPTGYYETELYDCDYPVWSPTTDPRQALKCAEKWAEINDADFMICYKKETKEYGFVTHEGYSKNTSLCLSVCQAIQEAIGDK